MAPTSRNLWHLGFVNLVRARAPANISVHPEVQLAVEPQRADLLLLRKEGVPGEDWTLVRLGGGYGRIDGAVHATYLVVIDEVAEAEQDDFLRIFSHHPVHSPEARRWLQQWVRPEEGAVQDVKELEGYDEMLQKLLDSLPVERRLAGLAPEERLAGLAPEERLAGLAPAHQLLALSDDAPRGFTDEYLRSLPAEVQDAIRRRIGRPSR